MSTNDYNMSWMSRARIPELLPRLRNATPLRLVAALRGAQGEKFGAVALDASGKRVAAVTTGVSYTPRLSGAQQRSLEMAQPGPYRVATWDVP